MKKILLGVVATLLLASCAPINGVHYDVTSDVYVHGGNYHPVYRYPNGKPFIIEKDKHGHDHHKDLKCIKYKEKKYKH